MTKVVIENPVLNSPYNEPKRHFYFDEDGITDREVNSRRSSSYFVPIPKPKKKGKQLELETEWTADRIEENKFINDIRRAVTRWRIAKYAGVTATTRQLLQHWSNADRERRLYFCQFEALETAIWLAEVADRQDGGPILRELRQANQTNNAVMLPTPRGASSLMPVASIARLFRRHCGTGHIAVKSAPPGLDIAASRTPDKVFLHVANLEYRKAVEATFTVAGQPVQSGRVFEIAPEDLRQY